MLDKQDLKQISSMISKSAQEIVSEIVGVLKHYSHDVDIRFDNLETRFDGLETRFDGLETRLDRVETILPTLVTKDYLDRSIANLRGELVLLTRKEDSKFVTLVKKLKKPVALDSHDATAILSMEPFPLKKSR